MADRISKVRTSPVLLVTAATPFHLPVFHSFAKHFFHYVSFGKDLPAKKKGTVKTIPSA
jgi:sarcosine oxidase gamma subunit